MPQKRLATIPPLPFGRDRALRFTDAAIVSERFTQKGVGTLEYVAPKSQPSFELLLAEVRTETARIVATSSSAMQFTATGFPTGVVIIPFFGTTITRTNGTWIEWGQAKDAVYLPPGGTRGECKARSALAIDVDRQRFDAIARAMAGPDLDRDGLVDLETPRALGLSRGGINFEQLFRQLVGLVNAMGCNPSAIEHAGLSDVILRSTVMMLAPALLHPVAASAGRSTANARISQLREYIDAHLAGKITLTDLERQSELSARSLQYAFRAATGCSPLQWITDRRLEVVHQRLLTAQPGETVTDIASTYFSNMGDFARRYRGRYGERPSDTLMRRS